MGLSALLRVPRYAKYLRMATNGDVQPAAVSQAQRIVSARTGRTLDEALDLMRARARSSDTSLIYIANAVIDDSIRFSA